MDFVKKPSGNAWFNMNLALSQVSTTGIDNRVHDGCRDVRIFPLQEVLQFVMCRDVKIFPLQEVLKFMKDVEM